MSTTTVETPATPPPTVLEPTIIEKLAGLEETACRLAEQRDAARARVEEVTAEMNAERLRADKADAYVIVLTNQTLAQGAAMRDLARRLTDAERALRKATAPDEPPRDSEAVAAPARTPEPPQRAVRRRSWRSKPHRRRH